MTFHGAENPLPWTDTDMQQTMDLYDYPVSGYAAYTYCNTFATSIPYGQPHTGVTKNFEQRLICDSRQVGVQSSLETSWTLPHRHMYNESNSYEGTLSSYSLHPSYHSEYEDVFPETPQELAISEGSTTGESVYSPEMIMLDPRYSLPPIPPADCFDGKLRQYSIQGLQTVDNDTYRGTHTPSDTLHEYVSPHSCATPMEGSVVHYNNVGVFEPTSQTENWTRQASVAPTSQVYRIKELELQSDDEDDDHKQYCNTDKICARASLQKSETDIDFESDSEIVAVDDEKDLDWKAQQSASNKRRTLSSNSRVKQSTNSTRTKRKQYTKGPIDENARVHKKTGNISTRRPHLQESSRTKILRHKSKKTLKGSAAKGERSFPCIFHHFGCNFEFSNKNEWKRHVTYQHMQLWYFRCDLDGCNPDTNPSLVRKAEDAYGEQEVTTYNDFNRKDLFTQHCRRMHGPTRNLDLCSDPAAASAKPTSAVKKRSQSDRKSSKSSITLFQPTAADEAAFESLLPSIRSRCWHIRRRAPSRSNCPLCDEDFDAKRYQDVAEDYNMAEHGQGLLDGPCERAWEERMEHLGRHYEKDRSQDLCREEVDTDLVAWAIKHKILHSLPDGRAWLVGVQVPTGEAEEHTGDMISRSVKGRSGTRRQSTRNVRNARALAEAVEREENEGDGEETDAEGETE